MYRHATSKFNNFKENFTHSIENLKNAHHYYIVGGDFNLNLLKPNSNDFIDKLLTLGCSQEILVATRFSQTTFLVHY